MKTHIIKLLQVFLVFLFLGFNPGELSLGWPSSRTYAADSTTAEVFSKTLRQSIKDLEYSDQVADDFQQMLLRWKNENDEDSFVVWKQKIDEAKAALQNKSESESHVAEIEAEIAKQLFDHIYAQFKGDKYCCDLEKIVKEQRVNCLGFSQVYYLLGNSIGLNVTPIMVQKCLDGTAFGGSCHAACLVNLTDNRVIEVDATFKQVSKPFNYDDAYSRTGYYSELKDETNPFGLHYSIRKITRKGILSGIYETRGCLRDESRQYAEAIDCFSKAIELDPELADAYYNRGRSYRKLGQYQDAIADFDKAIDLNAKHYFAYTNRAISFLALRNYDQALTDCKRAIEICPQYDDAYILRGRVYGELREMDNSIADITKAIELKPTDHLAYFRRAVVYSKFERYQEALADYSKSIEIDPNAAQAYFDRGVIEAQLSMIDKAKEDLLKAVRLDPSLEQDAKMIGIAYKIDLK